MTSPEQPPPVASDETAGGSAREAKPAATALTKLSVAAKEFVPPAPVTPAKAPQLRPAQLSVNAPAFVPRTSASSIPPSSPTASSQHSTEPASGSATAPAPAASLEPAAGAPSEAAAVDDGAYDDEAGDDGDDCYGDADAQDSSCYGHDAYAYYSDGSSAFMDDGMGYSQGYGYGGADDASGSYYCYYDPTTGTYCCSYPYDAYGYDATAAVMYDGVYGDSEHYAGQQEDVAGQGPQGEDGIGDEELLAGLHGVTLASGDASELLRMFFPQYSDAALRKLLATSSGDLLTAFQELCAMEQQQQQQQAGAAQGGRAAQRDGGGKGAGAGHGKEGPKGAALGDKRPSAAFKLDPQAFPTLAGEAPKATQQQQLQQQPDAGQPAPSAAPSPAKLDFAARVKASAAAQPSANGTPAKQAQAQPAAKVQLQPQASPSTAAAAGPRPLRGDMPRVTTGAAVSQQYADARAEAQALARVRNQYFQQATLAYLSGNKGLAKELGAKGRTANDAMKAAHAAAARKIFAARNAHLAAAGGSKQQQQLQHGGKGPAAPPAGRHSGAAAAMEAQARDSGAVFVDLHGLHAAEAKQLLEQQIESARSSGASAMRVCVGTGSHTKGAKTPARLPVAVTDTLLANHMTFKVLQPGLLEAYL